MLIINKYEYGLFTYKLHMNYLHESLYIYELSIKKSLYMDYLHTNLKKN